MGGTALIPLWTVTSLLRARPGWCAGLPFD